MKIEPTKEFACMMSIMLESKLIWYKHFHLFCDDIILAYEKPPYWIIELAAARYQGDTIQIVNRYIHSEPFIDDYLNSLHDHYIACLYMKYDRREISWASFLLGSGQYADHYQAVKVECEYVYKMLNEYEAEEFDMELEHKQSEEIRETFRNEIMEVQNIYDVFRVYFKQYIKKEREAPM